MTTINSSTKRAVVVAVAVAALTGCGAGGGDRTRVTVSARSAVQAASGAASAIGGVPVAGGVTLDRVKLVIREIQLERHAAAADGAAGGAAASTDDDGTPDQGPGDAPGTKGSADDDGTPDQGPGDAPGTAGAGDDDGTPDQGRGDAPGTAGAGGEVEVSAGPYLVDLSGSALASGTIVEQFALDVAEGTYDELKFRIHHLEDGQRLGDDDVDSRQSSVVVAGTLPDGRAFTFRSRLNDQQKLKGTFVVGGAAPSNITLTIDPTRWFLDAGGALLDPTVEANRQAIERNIRASIDAFDDDDHDGRDDHGRNGADDGPNHT
jgi:hypothetical protein